MSEFFWVANHPGLDLFNTAAADDNGDPVELLDGFDALAAGSEKPSSSTR